jgi:hypothetical protein
LQVLNDQSLSSITLAIRSDGPLTQTTIILSPVLTILQLNLQYSQVQLDKGAQQSN